MRFFWNSRSGHLLFQSITDSLTQISLGLFIRCCLVVFMHNVTIQGYCIYRLHFIGTLEMTTFSFNNWLKEILTLTQIFLGLYIKCCLVVFMYNVTIQGYYIYRLYFIGTLTLATFSLNYWLKKILTLSLRFFQLFIRCCLVVFMYNITIQDYCIYRLHFIEL